ncbi:MAG TPA: hypothetical protein VFL83_08765 [Anaeromyxobacter sp.]|nr:hypothetical protein [Anaeromyxobacter sp.]
MNAAALAQSVTEGGNLFGVFLCTAGLATLRKKGSVPEVNALLVEGLQKYAPAFRAMRKLVKGSGDVEPALERLEVLVRLGVNFDRPSDVADLRAAIRELLSNLGFALPRHAPGPGIACELHGRECPPLADE